MGRGQHPQQRGNAPQGSSEPAKPNLDKIMNGSDVESAREIVKAAQAWGKYLKDEKLTTAQIRSIFGEVRRIEMGWPVNTVDQAAERALILLKPKLAYQAERDAEKNRSQPVRKLESILQPAIDMVQSDRARFQRFVDFFEAILAYHKAAGGK